MAWCTMRFSSPETVWLLGQVYSISVPRLWWNCTTARHTTGSSVLEQPQSYSSTTYLSNSALFSSSKSDLGTKVFQSEVGSEQAGLGVLASSNIWCFSRRNCERWWVGQWRKQGSYLSLGSRSIWLVRSTLWESLRRVGICSSTKSMSSVARSSSSSFFEMNYLPFRMNFFMPQTYLYQLMEPNPGHQPQRFLEYVELQDKSGFMIDGCNHVFKFDPVGGWYDEYCNYYNCEGEADDPPSYSESQDSYYSRDSSSDEDEYEKQFGVPKDLSSDEDQQVAKSKKLEKIAGSLLILQTYPVGKPMRVYFSNADKLKKKDLFTEYQKECKGILNVILKGQGEGYFVVKDDESAEALIRLEGLKILPRGLTFRLESVEAEIMDPLQEADFEFKQQKRQRYMPKMQTEEHKSRDKDTKWGVYRFEKRIFNREDDFKEWMTGNGFNANDDFEEVQPIKGEKLFGKIKMKEEAMKAVNGLEYKIAKVIFEPIE